MLCSPFTVVLMFYTRKNMGSNAHSESFVCYICNNLIPVVVPSAGINNVLVNLKTIKIRIFLRTNEGNSGPYRIPLQCAMLVYHSFTKNIPVKINFCC